MRKFITAAAALAAFAVPSSALAAGHSFTGVCHLGGFDVYGPTFDAPTVQTLSGVGTCTGNLDDGVQQTYTAPFAIQHSGVMVKISDVKTAGPLPARVLLLLASGPGTIRFGTAQTAPTIAFNSTQSLYADVFNGALGGLGVATVTNSGTGEPVLDATLVALTG